MPLKPSAKTVVIVGGGLGGLAAAVQLGRLGVPAVLLLRQLDVPINAASRGPNGGLAVWRGRRYTLPVGGCSLLTTDLIGASAKRELARLLTSMRTVNVDEIQDVSIGAWLRTRSREPDVIQLVLAMVRQATYCDDPDRLSASAAIDQLGLSMRGAVLCLHHGWASLVASLRSAATAGGVTIVSRSRVAGVTIANGRAAGVMLADGASLTADAVIVATGPGSARQLLHDASAFAAPPPTTTAIRIASLDLTLRTLPRERTVFALGIDEPWCFSADSTIARVAPPRGAVVHLAKCLPAGTQGAAADEHQLERAMDLLQPGWRDVVVYRRFVPSAPVSHAIVTYEAGGFPGRTRGRVPGLDNVFLAGDWIGPIGQLADAAVASGVEAARSAARVLAGVRQYHGAY